MRSLFIAFLIVLFAGVQTAAAFSNAHKDTTVSEQAMSVGQGAPDMVDAAFSHHAKCCEKSGKAGSIAKKHSPVAPTVFPIMSTASPIRSWSGQRSKRCRCTFVPL
ncbi:hypothetical protein QW131_17865 [Roseibium salinum]|nr:hypothetical protein [Roseibium salinum]